MTHPLYPQLSQWCHENGWTDLFVDRYQFWAFPPGGVLPLPVPSTVLEDLHSQHYYRGLKYSVPYAAILIGAGATLLMAIFSNSPMPLVAGFVMSAIAIGILDDL